MFFVKNIKKVYFLLIFMAKINKNSAYNLNSAVFRQKSRRNTLVYGGAKILKYFIYVNYKLFLGYRINVFGQGVC